MSPICTVAIIAPGTMGSAVGRKLVDAGCIVLADLDGRSQPSRQRASQSGMVDTPLSEIVMHADIILSIVPPKNAFQVAQSISELSERCLANNLVFVDCNAVNPVTVRTISDLFSQTPIKFLDACIIGGPPSINYDPTFYVSAEETDADALKKFENLSKSGLKITPLVDAGATIGSASALKMSYAGISKGLIGLCTTMILGSSFVIARVKTLREAPPTAAYSSSPATSQALLKELNASQPMLLQRIVHSVPQMLPKAYRWVAEMNEIADFVGEGPGEIYSGMAKTYERIEYSNNNSRDSDSLNVKILKDFAKEAKEVLENAKK